MTRSGPHAQPLRRSLWTDHLFISTALQYYVTGRYAVLAGQVPVAGNLLHHSIEMFLKGGLAKKQMALNELKGFGHNLPKLWTKFKEQLPDPSLTDFDTLVAELHKFDDLRYPDSILAKGMSVNVGVRKALSAAGGPTGPEPRYELCLENLDALVGAIFRVASVNQKAYVDSLSPRARECLKEHNTQPWAG